MNFLQGLTDFFVGKPVYFLAVLVAVHHLKVTRAINSSLCTKKLYNILVFLSVPS